MSAPDGGPAFPRDHARDGHNGMTLRDYFAAKAMVGLLTKDRWAQSDADMFARDAYTLADAMLKAREAQP